MALLWSVDEIDWYRRRGTTFRLLGRVGKQQARLQVCDFRTQRGVYVLYDDFGPYYVGLTVNTSIGDRLKKHLGSPKHAKRWDRFSWFGFRPVSDQWLLDDGTCYLDELPDRFLTQSKATIQDVEALLIFALRTHHRGNAHQEKFAAARQWRQVLRSEVAEYLAKVKPLA